MLTAAFATADGIHVDAHFGRCSRFDIYDIAADSVQRREVRPVVDDPGDSSERHASDSHASDSHASDSHASDSHASDSHGLQPRIDALAGCALVCVASIGPTAAARVVKARVHPMKTSPDTTIASILERLQVVLQGTPPPWLRKLHCASPDPSPAGGSR